MMKTVDAVCMMIPTFSTRAMRMEIMQRYSRDSTFLAQEFISFHY